MKQVERFSISLSKASLIYATGEKLSGTINLKVSERIKINGLNVVALGDIRVKWTDKATKTAHSKEENFLKLSLVTMEKARPDEEFFFDAGDYAYPFKVDLVPSSLPQSFSSDKGKIVYKVKGVIDIPGPKENNVEAEQEFTVLGNLDLNEHEELWQPIAVAICDTSCCAYCKTIPITTSITLFKTGFAPNEKIAFELLIDNDSTKDVHDATLSLIQHVKYKVPTSSKKESANPATTTTSQEIAQVTYPKKISARSVINWKSGFITVPANAYPSTLQTPTTSNTTKQSKNKLIEVSYTISYSFKGIHIKAYDSNDLTIPVTIGTIPIK